MSDKVILLVEDNQDDEELAMMAFERNRIANRIEVARDGQEALDYLFAQAEYSNRDKTDLPQVMLLDLKLPKIDGHEVLRQVRSNPVTRFLPVVVLTSSREEEDIFTSYNLGVNSYIRKPVDFSQFAEAIQHLQLYWLILNEPPVNTR